MEWTPRAERAMGRVPFFVRKRVRSRIEDDVRAAGGEKVTLEDVRASRKRFLSAMEEEIRGYRVETCFGADGCPNRAMDGAALAETLESLLQEADFPAFLKRRISGPLKFHHEFRVALADCPNACTQPQIKDVGIIGAVKPVIGAAACTCCGACDAACPDGAVTCDAGGRVERIDEDRCVACGRCAAACPTGTLERRLTGYRVQLGGRLGRHPRLAVELEGIHTEETVAAIVKDCIDFYMRHTGSFRRFGDVLTPGFLKTLSDRYPAR